MYVCVCACAAIAHNPDSTEMSPPGWMFPPLPNSEAGSGRSRGHGYV